MRIRHAQIVLALLVVTSVMGCGDETAPLTPGFQATGQWAGGMSQGTQTLGFFTVNVDAQGRVLDGMLTGPSTSLLVREGSINLSGLMKVEFRDGTVLHTTYLTKSADGTKLTGSGTLTAPDGTQKTVSLSLNRLG